MRLKKFLRADLVLTDLTASDVESAVREIATHLAARDAVPSEEEVREKLLAREESHSTAMGRGMALPHATIPGLDEVVLMVALAKQPVQFGPPEQDPVKVFFVLLSPPGGESQHIKLLARLCRLVRHPGVVEEIQGASSGEEAVAVIERVDSEHV